VWREIVRSFVRRTGARPLYEARRGDRRRRGGPADSVAIVRDPRARNFPWEYLYDGTDFVALSGAASIVRHVDADRSIRPLRVEAPLRVAVTVSAPTDQANIDTTREVAALQMALAPLVAANLVRVDFPPNGTIGTLASMIRAAEAAAKPFHVWHFIGHGRLLAREGATYLAFESANGTSQTQSGFELGTLLSNHPSLRLAVLNACEGARAAPDDSLTSVGAGLVMRGLPAAIAMQFSITDDAAIRFAEDFYVKKIPRRVSPTAISTRASGRPQWSCRGAEFSSALGIGGGTKWGTVPHGVQPISAESDPAKSA
jgi:CHAT domain-containing protein